MMSVSIGGSSRWTLPDYMDWESRKYLKFVAKQVDEYFIEDESGKMKRMSNTKYMKYDRITVNNTITAP